MTLAQFVKKYKSQEAAAFELGFGQMRISFWLNGRSKPREDSWAQLRAHGITSI